MDTKVINILFAILCFWHAIMQHKSQACLYFGQAIASEEYLKVNPRGFQDSLTDPADSKWYFTCVACLIGLLCYYFLISWFYLLLGFVNFIFVLVLVKTILPKVSSQKYLIRIIESMCRRHADYVKGGDTMRSTSALELIMRLSKLVAS